MAASSYDGGQVPVVIEDRTIFHPPEIQAQRVGTGGQPKVVTRQSPLMGFISLILLAACGGLGYLLLQERDNTNVTEVVTLEDQVTALEQDLESYQENYRVLTSLIDQSRNINGDIDSLLADPARAQFDRERREEIENRTQLTAVEWRQPAEAELSAYIEELKTIRTELQDWTPPAPPAPERSTNETEAQ
ncbi:MAG: hypothetical protein AAF292_01805 [Pseudomonadota bacterium]